MKIELEVTHNEISKMIGLLFEHSDMESVKNQLNKIAVSSNDSQSGEISKEGDNAFVDRME